MKIFHWWSDSRLVETGLTTCWRHILEGRLKGALTRAIVDTVALVLLGVTEPGKRFSSQWLY